LPASQLAQENTPAAEYVPSKHTVHEIAPSLLWEYPAAHFAQFTAPTAAEYDPAEQLLHAFEPETEVNEPALHLAQMEAPLSPW